MYGWSGFGAGLSPVTRYTPPSDLFMGRMEPTNLVRTGDVSGKLELPIGHEFTDIEPPIVAPDLILLGQNVTKSKPVVVVNSSGPDATVPGANSTPVVDAGFSLSDIPWWAWLGAAGAGVYAMKGKR